MPNMLRLKKLNMLIESLEKKLNQLKLERERMFANC